MIVRPSVLVTLRSGTAVTGVESLSVLSAGVGSGPLAPSSATMAVLSMSTAPAGSGASTGAAKTAELLPPAPKLPTLKVHRLPASLSGRQDQPGVLAPGLKVVLAGTVSWI